MKKIKRLIVFMLCLFIAGLSWYPSVVSAETAGSNKALYIALGDSITSGYGLESFANNDIKNRTSPYNFVTRLEKKLDIKTINFGVEGIDSTVLLKAINKPLTKEQKDEAAQLKKASLITLSIGGNNIFIPLMNAVNDRVGSGKNIFNADALEIQTAVLGLLFDGNGLNKLKENILKGAEIFTGNEKLHETGDFAAIISTIKSLNPDAKLVVQTIYNPYGFIMPDMVDKAIKSMNAEIIKGSDNGKNYKVADVYSAFAKAGEGIQLINADTGKSFDPHPTKKGHEVIYTVVAYAAGNRLPYNFKSNVANGKSAATMAAGELKVTVTPSKGYKLPQTIYLTTGKNSKLALTLINGSAAVPVAAINGDMTVTAVCPKQ